MRFLSLRLLLVPTVLCAVLAGACGSTEGLPSCADVDWIGDNDHHAQLTAAPTFSATEIAPGDPLTIQVPVDIDTRSVSVSIGSAIPGVGSGGAAETDGGEIVDVVVEDTNLPPGVYRADVVHLRGDISDQSAAYIAETDSQYFFSVVASGERSNRCLTELDAPTFIIANDTSSVP